MKAKLLIVVLGTLGASAITARHAAKVSGAALFATRFSPSQGLGPLFNGTSCAECHAGGGMGPDGLGVVTRIGRLTTAGFKTAFDGAPIARKHSIAELGVPCDLVTGPPREVNLTSIRNAPDLREAGLIDRIPEREIVLGVVARRDGVQGRPHWVGGHVGRFGWKADVVTLREAVANAFRNELGITSPLAPRDLAPAGLAKGPQCPGEAVDLDDDGTTIDAVTSYISTLSARTGSTPSPRGRMLFGATGCDACHTPTLGGSAIYSDLLLHDLGPDLDDNLVQGEARGSDWRTTPLVGVGARARLLHDGRARGMTDAVLAHGGEGLRARDRFARLTSEERDTLLAFLRGL